MRTFEKRIMNKIEKGKVVSKDDNSLIGKLKFYLFGYLKECDNYEELKDIIAEKDREIAKLYDRLEEAKVG